MAQFVVEGGTRLTGTIFVHGSKNATLPILAATLLVEEPIVLKNCPRLRDVENMIRILVELGCIARWEGSTLYVDSSGAFGYTLSERLSKELRSSIFLLGSVLGRFKKAVATYPGGCEIGNRPIDLHLMGLRRLGAEIDEDGGYICCTGEKLLGAQVSLDYPSVGATENIMLLACMAEGETVIHNAAREPEIVDLQDFLCACGFRVSGAGSSEIVILGGTRGHGCSFTIMPDRIVAGTYLTAAAITGGEIALIGAMPEHMVSMLEKLQDAGAYIRKDGARIILKAPKRPSELLRLETQPYPGFPTDMQPQFFALCSVASGISVIVENVFENRFRHAQELIKMGGKNSVRGTMAIVRGVQRLHGAQVTAHDLRGGAALVLAALSAEGTTVISCAERIDRGYLQLEEALCSIGAKVTRKD
ncbi:MAG: UDP-N-acetylglucosamine 1-carboxyvinyltransferase [Clostridia bacterium]|nr:UDP-N-acetylglucosamine 1-carboxyvinyltransferase [Clostridia bacterium]